MKIRLFPVAALTLGLMLACGGGDKKTETPPTPPPPPAEQPKPPEPAPTASTGDVGVPECDDYIKKMTECLGKMDATVKATYEATFTQTKDAWKQAASTPEGKAGLTAGCKAALDAMASMPCGGATADAKPADAKPADAKPAETKKEEPKKEEPKKEEPKKEEPKGPPPGIKTPPGQGPGHSR